MTPADPSRRHWEAAAAGLAARVNFAAWLDRFAPGVFAAGTVTAVALYALRRTREPQHWAWLALAAGLLVAGGVAWQRARRGFFTAAHARVFLEYQLGLDAALSAASDGVAAWPARGAVPNVLRWRAPGTLGWLAGALALLAASLWLPVPAFDPSGVRPVEKPPALATTEAWLQELAKLDVIKPESLALLEKEAKELAEKSPEDQYTHSALEAADALRAQTEQAAGNLARALDSAAGALAALADPKATPDAEQLKSLSAQLSAALQGMKDGQLSANAALLAQLAAANGSLGALSPEQAAALAQRLGQGGKSVRGVTGAQGAGAGVNRGLPSWRDSQGGNGPGQSGPHGLSDNQNGPPGSGGPGGGGPPAPLTFGDLANAGQGKAEGLTGDKPNPPALGDKIGEQLGAHEVDPTKAAGPMSAGAVAAPAAGGEAVWVNRLTPAERAALKNFFK